jgi:hypothetical protein
LGHNHQPHTKNSRTEDTIRIHSHRQFDTPITETKKLDLEIKLKMGVTATVRNMIDNMGTHRNGSGKLLSPIEKLMPNRSVFSLNGTHLGVAKLHVTHWSWRADQAASSGREQ